MSFFSSIFRRGSDRSGGSSGDGGDGGWHRPESEWMPHIEAPHGEKPVVLRELDVRAAISGLFAETTQTLTFYNPNSRDLEGSLTFPLPDGAVVCGYALDVDGRMVDGVVVPKQEARRILEAEERKGADPGLIEQVQGNVYRTRIYPIPRRGTRTIRIVYVTELTVQDQSAAYHLPLAHASHIESVGLRVEILQAPVEPVISGGLGNLSLKRWNENWLAEARLGKGIVSEDLQVRLPDLPDQFTVIEVRSRPASDRPTGRNSTDRNNPSASDDEVFFCISQALPEPDPGAAPWSPSRVAIAWDASGSHSQIDRDLGLVRELCTAWASEPEPLTIDVLVFRDRPDNAHQTFTIAGGDADELCDYLRTLPYDGGTDLSALDLSRTPHADDEAWLLFTDGMGTVGHGLPTLGAVRVYTIASQTGNDSAVLGYIARETGASYVNLVRTKVPQASQEIIGPRDVPWHVGTVAGCAHVHTRRAHGRMMLLGRMDHRMDHHIDKASASIALSGADAPGYHLSAEDAQPGQIVARAWAGMQVSLIQITDPDDGDALVDLGRRYGLVTPGTSLLVLESLDQYLEYDIEPPVTLPDMRAEFLRRRAHKRDEDDRRKRKQIDSVLNLWRARVNWWEKDFRSAWQGWTAKPSVHHGGEAYPEHRRDEPTVSLRAPGPPPPSGGPVALGGPPPPAQSSRPMPAAPRPAAPSMAMRSRMAAAPPAPAPEPVADMEVAASFSASAPMLMREALDDSVDGMVSFGADEDAYDDMDEGAAYGRPADEEGELDRKLDGGDGGARGARGAIKIKAWTPDTPYLTAMKAAEDDPSGERDAYDAYLDARAEFETSPSFYLDCGDYLINNGASKLGVRVLSNLLELGLDDPALMRMYAWRLQQADELSLAVDILERVLAKRDDEPQSHRDLALALGRRWQRDRDPEDAARSMELLHEVVMREWDRFPEIEVIALMELNRLIHLASQAGLDIPGDIDERLIKNLTLDVRISMSWDADLTDVDLHVYEPNGQHAYYGNNRTDIGGLVSRDFTQGYGPEEYVLRRSMPGTYIIKAHYYGSSQQSVTGPCTVIVHVFTNYGRADEREQVLTLRLDRPRDQVLVGEIDIESTGSDADEDSAGADGRKSATQEMPNWRARFESLHAGMTLNEITEVVGQPAEIGGETGMVLVYRPSSGVTVHVLASPRLTAVKLLTEGAELDLV